MKKITVIYTLQLNGREYISREGLLEMYISHTEYLEAFVYNGFWYKKTYLRNSQIPILEKIENILEEIARVSIEYSLYNFKIKEFSERKTVVTKEKGDEKNERRS